MKVIYDRHAHEALTDTAWDDVRVREWIASIVEDADRVRTACGRSVLRYVQLAERHGPADGPDGYVCRSSARPPGEGRYQPQSETEERGADRDPAERRQSRVRGSPFECVPCVS
jgi:hypothetical protein